MIYSQCKGEGFFRESREVSDSARGKVVVRERRDVTDSARGNGFGRERRDVTDIRGERSRSGETCYYRQFKWESVRLAVT